MTTAKTLYLVRHGETEWNRAGRIQGGLDSPLTALGRAQAEAQGRILARVLPTGGEVPLHVSPLPRARITAKLARPGHEQIIEPRLTEIFCGAWEGLTPDERAAGWPDLAARCQSDLDLYEKAPGGEGLDGVEARVADFLGGVGGPAIIVAHKVVLLVMRGLLLGLNRDALHRLDAPQGVVIAIEDGRETILR